MSEPNTIQTPEEMPFEAAMARLEVIVKAMEHVSFVVGARECRLESV